jgi:hypothetical protein
MKNFAFIFFSPHENLVLNLSIITHQLLVYMLNKSKSIRKYQYL